MPELLDIYDKNGNRTDRQIERGKPLQEDEYVFGVHVWIINCKQEFLLTKRSEAKGHKWHGVGGMAAVGDDSFTTVLREVGEEVGITLDSVNGQIFKRHIFPSKSIIDVWVFRQNIDISKVVLQEEEACEVMLATKEEVMQIIEEEIIDRWYPYLKELMDFYVS